jgi:isopentenyldiphosphate isomerase
VSTHTGRRVQPDRTSAADELVDEVDVQDRVIRAVPRATVRAERLRHRCVFVVVRSSTGAVLVHRRAAWKDLWPGRWDIAVGGVVASGERWDDAARRELAEEVGIEGPEPLEVGRAVYEDAEVAEVARVYRVTSDGPLTFADGEVDEADWIGSDEIAAWASRHELVPDSVALVLPLLLEGRA